MLTNLQYTTLNFFTTFSNHKYKECIVAENEEIRAISRFPREICGSLMAIIV